MRATRSFLGVALALFVIVGWTSSAAARPGAHTIRVEGAGALQVGEQFSRFGFGGGFGLGYEYRIIPEIGIEARYHAYFWPVEQAPAGSAGYGAYHGLGIAARYHPLPDLAIGDLWIDVGANVVLTGNVARPGIEVGVGMEFEVAWFFRVGPFVRFAHVFQPDGDALGSADASFLVFGVSAAFLGEEDASDRDGDGILDGADQCPDEPEDEDGFQDEDGCPDPDNDRDGIPDASDACVDQPEDMDGDRDEDGCPEEAEDTDGDGITDADDQCVQEPEDRDEFQDEDGCPDPDNDGDGIPDTSDQCPLQAETMNGHEDEDGCPDETPEETEMRQLTERIFFPHDRVHPTGESRPVIRRLAELIQAHTEWVRIRIEGHASDTGEAEYNLNLSRRRAERIRELLIEMGVDGDRLEVEAYGASRPDVEGETEEARAMNRRVNFTVIERH